MRDLERRTGVHRETIRVYFRHGLLPEPARPAANVADYDDSHVKAILAVRKLQRDDGLTLPHIKVAIRGKTRNGRAEARALRNFQLPLDARLGIGAGVQLSELADWTYVEEGRRV